MVSREDFVLSGLKGKILDIGFSVGPIHDTIKLKFGEKNVVGLDIEFRWKVKGNYVLADAEKMPFNKNSFDSIFAGELIEHLYNPEEFLKESSRILKKNGLLLLTTPNRKSLINRLFKSYHAPAHIKVFSFSELKQLLESNGFKVRNFFCLSFTEESSEGSSFKLLFPLRKLLNYVLPDSLREDMIVLAEKNG